MKKQSSSALAMIRLIDKKNLTAKAIEAIEKILNDPLSKRSEVLNAADKLIKIRFQYQDAVRRQAIDELDIQIKQLTLAEKTEKLRELIGLKDVGDGQPDETKPEGAIEHSRPFEPSLKPDDVSDEILVEG